MRALHSYAIWHLRLRAAFQLDSSGEGFPFLYCLWSKHAFVHHAQLLVPTSTERF